MQVVALRSQRQAEVVFNYLGQLDSVLEASSLFRPAHESAGPSRSPKGARHHLLEINGQVVGGRLGLCLTYSPTVHRRSTIEALASGLEGHLRRLIADVHSLASHASFSAEAAADLNPRDMEALLAELGDPGSRETHG